MYLKRAIGLTGGISTGKSTVSRYLAETYQLPVLDADIYAREAVVPNSPIWQAIIARYGQQLLLPNGDLDRPSLATIIFNAPVEKSWLESQIHPYVRERFQLELLQLKVPCALLVIPLLFEAKMTDLVSEVWVVACDEELQLQRLMERDRLTLHLARSRIQSQLPLSTKIDLADFVLYNNTNIEDLYQQVDRALAKM
jgi:dephospho-CoA kinase